MLKVLVNAILKDGTKIPMGAANDSEDAQAMIKMANEKFGLNEVVDYEIIKNPDEEDLKPATDMMKNFVQGQKNAEKARQLDEICEAYVNGELSGRDARNRIEALYDNEEDADNAIEYMYNYHHYHDDYYDDCGDGEDEDDCDDDCCLMDEEEYSDKHTFYDDLKSSGINDYKA